MVEKKPKILAIVGPTASGKTSLSITLAEEFNGEVISADSRQVYRGMDLGTGKVTKAEMQGVRHHLLDVADPVLDIYTAADFKHDASLAINEILARKNLPIIAGGTFMYLDTLLGKISIPEVPPDLVLRRELEKKDSPSLLQILTTLDAKRASNIDASNPRRLIRAIEIATALGEVPAASANSPYDVLTIGIALEKEDLHKNIEKRLIDRLEAGMIKEVEGLLNGGVTHERLESFGLEYRYISRHLLGQIDYRKMQEEILTKSRQFAKRQLTWLKRDKTIMWFKREEITKIFSTVSQFLKD